MTFNRFGASKFRNSVAHVPPREEWYRSALPITPSNSTTSAASSFRSEIKTSRRLIVTVTPSGDASWRTYDAVGGQAVVGSGKLGSGGGVGDWDLGRIEGGELVAGGLDGSISLYALQPRNTALSAPKHSTSPTGSPIASISLHPTVPSVVLSSSISQPAAIWDLSTSPTSSAIQLEAKEPKGMWSLAWSADGRLVAGVGKSGTAYIWDPRSSTQPTMTRPLPLQPLKPVRVVWVGDDIFVTSTSRTRNREYHLFSPSKSLATVFTQNIDTNTVPLIPTVDHERRIVYLAGKADMTLRQVELSGPNGFQETLHPLPHAISSAGLALASPTTLPVMQAQIATVLVPVLDKDGEAIVPFGIRVPRRQLIDFHEDLYPQISGFLPESSAAEWFSGADKSPLPISLDPARRKTWEAELAKYIPKVDEPKAVPSAKAVPSEKAKTAPEPDVSPQTPASAPAPASEPPKSAERIVPAPITPAAPTSHPAEQRSADTPTLEGDETYSSTTYKARIIAQHIKNELEKHRNSGSKEPMFVGLQGPQGCAYLSDKLGIKAAVLSLDDLYHTNANLKAVAIKHLNNHLLSGRGPPGTHDAALAKSVLTAVRQINSSSSSVDLPIFDKSLVNGEGDRSDRIVTISGPIDVFILEGWSMGFSPLSPARLAERYSSRGSKYFAAHSLEALTELNEYLSAFSANVYPFFSSLITVVPTSYDHVFAWRLEQEHAMKAANGGVGMSDEQVRHFVERYMPGYELWREGIWERGWSGLELKYGREREVLGVERKEGKAADVKSEKREAKSEDVKTADVKPEEAEPTPFAQKPAPSPQVPPPTQVSAPPATSAPKPAPISTPAPGTAKATSSSTPKAPFNPTYSRKFMSAKAPLIPTYDQLPPLASLHPDSIVLKCTRHLGLFPIQGPGGRLGVHPLAKKGRMPNGGQGYLSGGVEIADFAIEPFENEAGSRVAIAGEDGAIRVWTIGKEGVEGPGSSAEMTLKGIDKIVQLAFHPTAKDLLVAATNDHTSSSLRFFDLSTGTEAHTVPIDVKGIFNFMISPDGALFAIASKDGRVVVLDPRRPDTLRSSKAHDSPRSFQLAWISTTHLISVGFNRGSQRRINLYAVSPPSIETIHSMMIDISPSVLFPSYDPDTRILYVWGKGERAISAYEVDVTIKNEPISKLPTYTAGDAQMGVAFKSKTEVDVKKVEIMKALRMTGKIIEEVTFSIPRNKPEFFQDDIYVDTVDTETAVNSAGEWLAGKDVAPVYKSLKPDGMTPLSEAPKTTTAAKAKFVPGADVLSEEQKKRKEMDALFNKAKADESSDEEVEMKGLAPPDDDW